MNNPTTLWLVCALIALATEFATGTLYLLVAACALTGGGLAAWANSSTSFQFSTASAAGISAYLIVSHWKSRIKPAQARQADHPDLGQAVRIISITGKGRARVFYRGTEWDASFSGPPLTVGSEARITGQDGNHLIISPTPEKDSQ
jgi:membrane protein implicated in regulation of membrane protease activity